MKRNILLLFSTVGALLLFAVPSKIMLLLEAAVFLAVVFAVWLGDEGLQSGPRLSAFVLAALFTGIGMHFFTHTHGGTGAALVLAVICGAAAFYAFYRLSCRIDAWICDLLHVPVSTSSAGQWKANWFFPISAGTFFFLEIVFSPEPGYVYSILAAVGIAVVVAGRVPSLPVQCSKDSWQWKAFCGLTAVGICLFQYERFLAAAPRYRELGILCAVGAFFFVFICVRALYHSLWELLGGFFSDIRPVEAVLYGAMVLFTLCAVTVTFLKTDAFYGSGCPYDIIYTSDSPILVQNNAYLWLTYEENDLRQPLFAVFAAPFAGLPYLVSRLLSASPALNALLLNYPQILLLFLANLLLAGLLKLTGGERIAFVLLSYASYPALLFSLMMEQYIIAYFYLILFLYCSCEKKPEPLAFCGAGGTLLTSVVTLPLMSQSHPMKAFKAWLRDMLNGGIGFIVAILAFARLDVLLNVADSLLSLIRFSGERLSIVDKVFQYTAFIRSCLYAPAAGIFSNMWGDISWQLTPADGICWSGVVIAALSLLSAVLNRDKKASRIAAAWVGFSFCLLVILGWGTQENGLILYALYFGWAFLVLLYQLAQKLESVCSIRCLSVAAGLAGAVLLAVINLPAIINMISFAIAAYPV